MITEYITMTPMLETPFPDVFSRETTACPLTGTYLDVVPVQKPSARRAGDLADEGDTHEELKLGARAWEVDV